MKANKAKEEEEEEGERCVVGRRLQLPCRCAAWLAQRLAGSQSQCREAVPLQFSVSERTGRGGNEGGEEIQRCRGGREEGTRRLGGREGGKDGSRQGGKEG